MVRHNDWDKSNFKNIGERTSRMTLTIRLHEKNATLTRYSVTSQETVFQGSLKCFHVWVNEENF